jgi:hypothetical protein
MVTEVYREIQDKAKMSFRSGWLEHQ